MIDLRSLRNATLFGFLFVCLGCSAPQAVPQVELASAPANPAPGSFELTVCHGALLPQADAVGEGVVQIPLYHEARALVFPAPWSSGDSAPLHAFAITGEELSAPWTLATESAPLRLTASEMTLQPILGLGWRLHVSCVDPEEGLIRVVAVDALGAELGPGFAFERGGYLWIGERDWNRGATGTLVAIRPASRVAPPTH